MRNYFWSNTIWYIALAATSAAALAAALIKTKERKKTFAFFLAVLGFAYLLENILVLIFNAYSYQPMLVQEAFFDAVLGNIFSQVSVSSSILFICVLRLSNGWLAGFAVVYYLIDLLFSHLGIYTHNWYRSEYTLAGFLIYGTIVKHWFKKFFSLPSKLLYYITLFFGVFAIAGNLLGTASKLLNIRIFLSGIVPHPSRSHTATAEIYGAVLTAILIALYKWKIHWLCKIPVLLLLLVCQYGLVQSGIIITRTGWWLFVILLDLFGYLFWVVYLDKLLEGKKLLSKIK